MKYGLELDPDSGFAPVVRDVDSPPIPCGTAMIQKILGQLARYGDVDLIPTRHRE
jgi:hypothetical protein